MQDNQNGASNGEAASTETILEKYEADAEPFKSDTGRYLMQHLLDEYPGVAEAVIYNLIQNVWDNRLPGQKAVVRFVYSTKQKRLQFTATGYAGIKDWERYNSLHSSGPMGRIRRGEGAKVLVPIADEIRTETHPFGGAYLQSVWWGNHVFRSDKSSGARVFADGFAPTAIQQGQTVITASGVYDEVGDRYAGVDFENAEKMVRLIQLNWNYLLQHHPDEIQVYYEVDGVAHEVKPWPVPEIADSEQHTDLEVIDAKGAVVGNISRAFFGFAKNALTELPPAALAVCTNDHAVCYRQAYGGPNQNRFFGYVYADFLAESETTDHLRFKATHAWRATLDLLNRMADDFMRKHAGIQRVTDPGVSEAMSEVTDQINRLVREEFPDWHPEGGVIEERSSPKVRTDPWIRAPKTDKASYDPGQDCSLTFEVVNPSRKAEVISLEARASVVDPLANPIYHKVWQIELPGDESRKIQDVVGIPDDAGPGTYTGRVSLVDSSRRPLHERLLSFDVPEAEQLEEADTGPKLRTPRRTKRARSKRGDALQTAYLARIDPEDGTIYESILDRNEWRVYVNELSPSWPLTLGEERAQRYHMAKCQILELVQLQLERQISLLEPDELTKDRLIDLSRKLARRTQTFASRWARVEAARIGK